MITPNPAIDARPVKEGKMHSSNEMIIHSELLSRIPPIRSGVSTRCGGVSREPLGLNLSYNVGDDPSKVTQNRERFFGALNIPIDRLAIPYQIHSAAIRRAENPGRYESCDALVTNIPELFLAVSIADCLPILLYDPVARAIAAVHSGWRGSKEKVLLKAIETLRKEFGSCPKDLVAFIGPAAGECCYEVGKEVAKEFPTECVVQEQGRKPRLDLKFFNKNILLESGVDEQRIEVSPLCTICTPAILHSYRRDGHSSGRMMGVIGIVP
ncbi:MAG: peptidoglycan editing factor PgeF [Ignavibacteriae bacterium]|nr:peptidoglycan editing factor PgeF [Ignavibacteria bacterium]MBI3364279.1 peptidoglycan editing factor PgeF [Ignavibacteriota bacterium]